MIFMSWSVIISNNSNSKLTDSEANTTDHVYNWMTTNKRAARLKSQLLPEFYM